MIHGHYDVIVIGIGGMGGAAAFELARRGRRVLGLEQYTLGHDRGSSHGRVRVIRKAYFEHPDYVPLLRRAYQRWYDLEQRTGSRLLTECGVLSLGAAASEVVRGVRESSRVHGLPVENLSGDDLRKRYPQLRLPEDFVGVLERDAGVLAVEDCVLTHAREAQLAGADLREGEPVHGWEPDGSGVIVRTARHRYAAAKLVITAGPWAGQMLKELRVPLTVMRQVQLWFTPADDSRFRRDVFPVWLADTPGGAFYGVPVLDVRDGVKTAQHYGAPEAPDPAHVDHTVRPADETAVRAFLERHVPGLNGPLRKSSVCLYTMTPDRHFLIGTHPAHPQVCFAAGFSGHGFKFASVVGEILADLAERGRTDLPIGLLGLSRFSGGR